MKSGLRYLLAAAAAALLGVLLVAAGRLQRDIARAYQDTAVQRFDRAEAALAEAERSLAYTAYVPGVGGGPLNAVRARRAAVQYWQRRYQRLVPDQDDPVAAVLPENVDLQMLVANGMYRVRLAEATDRASTLEVLNASINAYATALRNAARREDAAFNYEYVVRLRDDVEAGRVKPGLIGTEPPHLLGRPAAPDTTTGGKGNFKVLVPLSPIELLQEQDDGAPGQGTPGIGDPGKGQSIKRRG